MEKFVAFSNDSNDLKMKNDPFLSCSLFWHKWLECRWPSHRSQHHKKSEKIVRVCYSKKLTHAQLVCVLFLEPKEWFKLAAIPYTKLILNIGILNEFVSLDLPPYRAVLSLSFVFGDLVNERNGSWIDLDEFCCQWK